MKLQFKYIIILTVSIVVTSSTIYFLPSKHPDMEWIMIDVNYSKQQADAHLIRTKNGKTILIDVGHRTTGRSGLLPLLKKYSINEIDIVFISHPHIDHYGGLETLMNNQIKIQEIYFNIPDKNVCDHEIPWGCNYNDILSMHKKLKKYGTIIKRAKAGQKFNIGKHTSLKILYAFDGINTPVGKTGVNDLSLIMLLQHNQFRFLFTGDLNRKIGTFLAKSANDIGADILKVPHHGTEGVAPNEFFEKVSPKYALIPAPKHLWLSKRSERIRSWFANNNIPVFVNGISGHIQVAVHGKKLLINPEKSTEQK